MAQAIVDPEELRRFASNLRTFHSALGDQISRIQGQFGQLGASWRDQEHQKFAQTFEQTMRALRRFGQEAEQYVSHLHRKAEAVEEYQRR